MTAFLATLLRLSLLGSLLAGVLFLLKPLLRGRISRAAAYYLWLLVLLRLCVPLGLTVQLPAQEAPTAPAPVQTQTTAPETAPESTAPAQTAASPAPTDAPAEVPTSRPLPLAALTERLLAGIWAAGFVLVGGWYVYGYRSLARRIRRTAVPAGEEAQAVLAQLDPRGQVRLVESSAANAPLLLGLRHPTVVLPAGVTDPARLWDILSHELTHAWRYDLLVKWFAALAASIHWFNPLLLLVRREIGRACELACDEAVVKTLDAPARKHYGETLLALAAEAPVGVLPLAVTLCEEKKTLEERLVSIVKIHRRTPAAILLTVVLVLGVGGCSLVTGARQGESPDPYGTLYLPQADVTLHLDMSRKDVEALLGEGEAFYREDVGLSYPTAAYNSGDGLLLVEYEKTTEAQGERVRALSCLAAAGYSPNPDTNSLFTPEAQKMFQEAEPFQFQAVQNTGYGDSYPELKAAFPDGTRLVQPMRDDPDRLRTVFEANGETAAVYYYLTEETGVYQIEIVSKANRFPLGDIESFNHVPTGVGYSPVEGNMTWDFLEPTLGPGTSQGDAQTVYGSGDDILTVTGTGTGVPCVLETQGANWETDRGIHVGHTLADLNARYDGTLQSDQAGRFYQVEGAEFLLTFRLDDTDTITSMRLEGKGAAS